MKVRVQLCTRRRVALAVIVAAATAVSVLAAGASPAFATLPPAEVAAAHTVLEDPANASTLSSFLRATEPYTWETYEQWVASENATGELVTTGGVWPATATQSTAAADVTSDTFAARIAAGTLPEVSALGTVALAAGALYVGWKIGRWIDTKYLGMGGDSSQPTTGPLHWGPDTLSVQYGATAQQWQWMTAGTAVPNLTGATIPTTGFYLGFYTCSHTGSACTAGSGSSTLQYAACTPGSSTSCGTSGNDLNGLRETKLSAEAFGVWTTLTGSVANVQGLFASASNMRAHLGIDTVPQPFTTQAPVSSTCTSCVSDPGTITGTPLANAIGKLENHDDTAVSLAHQISPSTVPDDPTGVSTTPGITITTTGGGASAFPYYIPTVLPGETVTEYQDRLAAKQWLGGITVTTDTTPYPAGSPAAQLAPSAITSVTANATTVQLYDHTTGQPNPWPAAGTGLPQLNTSADPVTVTDIVGGSGSGVPPIDMSPMTGMSDGCNFPFGVLCWVTGSVSAMNTTPVAPELNWTLPNINMGSLGTKTMGQHYDVNLGNTSMDTYMGWIRSIISWVLWLGTIWYVGSRLLGLKGGGDPTDAINEAYGSFTE